MARPLFTTLASLVALPGERSARHQLAGLLISFLGVLVVLGATGATAMATAVGSAEAVALLVPDRHAEHDRTLG
ncbi:hypothetical protein [Frankia tisae]|uniref:hypothetical protein n=1 Tax=Frankia tisae TaxID=2950104 RepID=UPI0021C1FE85|nr:hypothetical protein [Frankia tisae]